MDLLLGYIGKGHVYDKGQAFYVNATCCHVCAYEESHSALLECIKRRPTLIHAAHSCQDTA